MSIKAVIKKPLRELKGIAKRYRNAYFKKELDSEIQMAFDNYSEKSFSKSKIKDITKDIKRCYIFQEFVPDEYFMFRFYDLSKKEQKEYLSGAKRRKEVFKRSTKESRAFFTDKYKTYELYKKYYHRDMVKITSVQEDKDILGAFIQNHDQFIVKPTGGYQGSGIHIVTVDHNEDEVCEAIKGEIPCVLEELIHQTDEVGKYHPASVNSVRVVSYLGEKDVEIMFAIFRMGVGGNVVDNIGAGGIVAAVDVNTGKLSSCGYQYNGLLFEEHPNTGVRIKGSQIPMWEELMTLTKELAYVVKEQRVIGWDFALTNDGWTIIEANHSPSCKSIQMIQGGMRKQIEKIWEN